MKEYFIKFQAKTPIWSGDVKGQNSLLRETGIIGSLRWWYEIITRGFGFFSCDPTNTNCKEGNRCRTCELFGCTGWMRKFRLEIDGFQKIEELSIGVRITHYGKRHKFKRKISGLVHKGEIRLRFVPLRKISDEEWFLLNRTFEVIEEYSALGAHLSQGNGVIKIIINSLPKGNGEILAANKQKIKNTNGFPNLENFFFYTFRLSFKESIAQLINDKVFWVKNPRAAIRSNWDTWKKLWEEKEFLPLGFHVRDSIRMLEPVKNLRHEVFGKLGNGSKIFVSHSYKVNDINADFRVWGYDINENLKSKIIPKLETDLQKYIFSNVNNNSLISCKLIVKKTGRELLEKWKK